VRKWGAQNIWKFTKYDVSCTKCKRFCVRGEINSKFSGPQVIVETRLVPAVISVLCLATESLTSLQMTIVSLIMCLYMVGKT
jgi:succinate dehydrogenase/fumarate reductase-like Fe-S protein